MTHTKFAPSQTTPRTALPSLASVLGVTGFFGFAAAATLAGAVTPGYSPMGPVRHPTVEGRWQ
jgi:hypothetical protein